MLTPRQRVITAMRREVPDRVPKFADFSPAIYERFLMETNVDLHDIKVVENKGRPLVTFKDELGLPDPADYFAFDVRAVEFGATKLNTDFSHYFQSQQLPVGRYRIDEWGIAYVRGSEYHFEDMVHPMQDFTSLEELETYPWPDVTATYRREIAQRNIEKVHQKDLAVLAWPPMKGGTFFETAWGLRGFENMVFDMMTNKDFASCLLDKITELSIANACFFASCGADILLTGDDFGMQDRMMISPAMWREWFKPRYATLIAEAKKINPDLLVFYHSDGMIEPIIPELIEIGVDILNPVQPECMDVKKLKQQFGDRIAFWGTIGTQSTLPFGTPESIKQTVHERVKTLGLGGGLLLAPTHKIEPDVPWENVLALFDAIDTYGVYS